MKTLGIHHITSIAGHPQENIDFNAGVLGLRLVKKTLNFDDKDTYHFYYGNDQANSGLVTSFPFLNADDGEIGGGQVEYSQYGVRPGTFPYWEDRLSKFGIRTETVGRFGQKILRFRDPVGLGIELVETDQGPQNQWHFNGVPSEDAIVGVAGATLLSRKPDSTFQLLTEIMGYEVTSENEEAWQLRSTEDLGGMLVLAKAAHPLAKIAAGSVHHIAFKVQDNELEQWSAHLTEKGFYPTEVKDRKYFRSVYFREKGGILFELATLGPGMTLDEPVEHLGETLFIPPHFESYGEELTAKLLPVEVRPIEKFANYGYRTVEERAIVEKKQAILEEINQLRALPNKTPAEEAKLTDLRRQFMNTKLETATASSGASVGGDGASSAAGAGGDGAGSAAGVGAEVGAGVVAGVGTGNRSEGGAVDGN